MIYLVFIIYIVSYKLANKVRKMCIILKNFRDAPSFFIFPLSRMKGRQRECVDTNRPFDSEDQLHSKQLRFF